MGPTRDLLPVRLSRARLAADGVDGVVRECVRSVRAEPNVLTPPPSSSRDAHVRPLVAYFVQPQPAPLRSPASADVDQVFELEGAGWTRRQPVLVGSSALYTPLGEMLTCDEQLLHAHHMQLVLVAPGETFVQWGPRETAADWLAPLARDFLHAVAAANASTSFDLNAQLALLTPLAATARLLALQVMRYSQLCCLYSTLADRYTKIELMDDLRYLLREVALLKRRTRETSCGLHAQVLHWYSQAIYWLEEQLLHEGKYEFLRVRALSSAQLIVISFR